MKTSHTIDRQLVAWEASKNEAVLLAALRRLEKVAGNYNPNFPMAPGYHAEFKSAMIQARAAIAKATS
jgi:hypothetical protein